MKFGIWKISGPQVTIALSFLGCGAILAYNGSYLAKLNQINEILPKVVRTQ